MTSTRNMPARMKQMFNAIPMYVKVICALLSLGIYIGRDLVHIPGDVEELQEARIEDLEKQNMLSKRVDHIDLDLARIENQGERIICLLTLTEEVRARAAANPMVLERECR